MEIHKALNQISEIHEHLSRSEVYRGYRSVPIALSGILALAAAAAQPRFGGFSTPEGFLYYWMAVGVVASLLAGGGIIYNYAKEKNPRVRRITRTVVGQLFPCLIAGVAICAPLLTMEDKGVFIQFLPGLWAILFSVGVFASRPYLPRMIGWVALFYLIAGTILLFLAPTGKSLSPWGMGLTFGFGQIFGAVILYWNLERRNGV